METKVLKNGSLKIGDRVEITNSGGSSIGKVGDVGIVVEIRNKMDNGIYSEDFIRIKFISGDCVERTAGRFISRYKLVDKEWD